jgi:hypothetical protein
VAADLACPEEVMADPGLRKVIDPGRPVCLMFTLSLPYLPPRRAQRVVAGYARLIASGSYAAISAPRIDDAAMWERARAASAPLRPYNYTRRQLASLFRGLEMVPPGIGPAAWLRPGWADVKEQPPGEAYVLAGMAVKGLTRSGAAGPGADARRGGGRRGRLRRPGRSPGRRRRD